MSNANKGLSARQNRDMVLLLFLHPAAVLLLVTAPCETDESRAGSRIQLLPKRSYHASPLCLGGTVQSCGPRNRP